MPPGVCVEVTPGSFDAFAGLAADGPAWGLGDDGAPIPGLVAVATDAASPFGGFNPAGGINIGPARTLGVIAGRHIAAEDPA